MFRRGRRRAARAPPAGAAGPLVPHPRQHGMGTAVGLLLLVQAGAARQGHTSTKCSLVSEVSFTASFALVNASTGQPTGAMPMIARSKIHYSNGATLVTVQSLGIKDNPVRCGCDSDGNAELTFQENPNPNTWHSARCGSGCEIRTQNAVHFGSIKGDPNVTGSIVATDYYNVVVSATLHLKPPPPPPLPGTGPCILRPGAPAVYKPICADATTQAACAKVNMTCTWGAPPPPPPRPLSQQYWCNAPYKICEQCNHYTKPPCTATFRNESRSDCEAKCDPGPHPQGYTCEWSGKPGMRCEKQFAPFSYPNITSCEAKCKNPPPPPPV
jgi:hypothetical protein